MPEAYEQAWVAVRIATVQEGKSWSGHEHNHAFLNIGDGVFADVSRLSNADCEMDGRALAVVDWDDDGKLDMVLRNRNAPRLQVFHNRYGEGGSFLAVDLVGNGRTVTRDAISATVTVESAGRLLRRTLRAGEGYLAQSTKRLHFGLGDVERVERLTVAWPDGTSSTFEDVPADTRFRITQDGGEDEIAYVEGREDELESVQHAPATAKEGRATRVVLGYELPLAPVRIPSFADGARTVGDLAGKPVLLNFWGADCAGCLRELGEFQREEARFAALDVHFVPMNVDRGDDGTVDEAAARRALEAFGLDSPAAGFQDERLHETLFGTIYTHVFGPRTNVDAVLPTSFLLDAEGDLMVIYHGPVSVEQLEEDVAALRETGPEEPLDRLSHGFRLIYHERDFEGLAREFAGKGRADLAAYYQRVADESRGFFFLNGQRFEIVGAEEAGRPPR